MPKKQSKAVTTKKQSRAVTTKKEQRKAPRFRLHDSGEVKLNFVFKEESFSCDIFDYSRFGLGIRLPADEESPEIDDTISSITIEAFGHKRKLGEGKITRASEQKNYRMLGITLLGEFIDMDFLREERKIFLQEDEINSIKFYFVYQSKATEAIKNFSANFAFGLATYKRSLDNLDTKFAAEAPEIRDSLFAAIMQGVGREFKKYLDRQLAELKKIVESSGKREHEQNGFYLRRAVWPYLMESEFLKRTNLKPRGYAGDSMMMEMCYRNEYIGENSFGKIFHKHPIETEAAEAVRSRRRLINDFLSDYVDERAKKEKINVLSVACGPAWELQDFVRDNKRRTKVNLALLDQDEEALGEARRGLNNLPASKRMTIGYFKDSVRTLLRTNNPTETYGTFDFVYSMGLFDYLAEPVARAVLAKLYSMLDSGGKLIIGNYSVDNPTRYYMDYLMDWPLIYRSEDEFLELTENLDGKFDAEIGYDESGSQMFLNLVKR